MELNNRELSLLLWIVIATVLCVIHKPTRRLIPNLIKAVFQKKLSVIYSIMATYTIAMIFLLYHFDLWDSSQIKNTTVWFLTVGLVSLKDVTKKERINHLKNTIVDIFGMTALVSFLTGIYTFNFIVEFFLVPVAFLVGGMMAIAGTKSEYTPVKKLLTNLVVAAGFFTIGYTIYKIITDFGTFASKGTLTDFLIPGALSVLFLPLVYLLSVYAMQEEAFVLLNKKFKPNIFRYAKWYTLFAFAFNKEDLYRWKQFLHSRKRIETKKQLKDSIKFIKNLKAIERRPPSVSSEIGWSPYKAKDILIEEGLKTHYYQPKLEDEWSAISDYYKLDNGLLSNTIAYYVKGNSTAAKSLKLVLNVNEPEKALAGHDKLVRCAQKLFRFAMNQSLPNDLVEALNTGRDKQVQIGHKRTTISKNKWIGSRLGGYNINFTIEMM